VGHFAKEVAVTIIVLDVVQHPGTGLVQPRTRHHKWVGEWAQKEVAATIIVLNEL
jgi:hypothetical protein